MRGVRDTLSVCGFQNCQSIPGVRKKRVPLANFPAPLRGARAAKAGAYQDLLVPQKFTGDLNITLLVRVRHAWSVHPLSGPLDWLNQILGIFDHAGINQAFTILADLEAFSQAFAYATGQRSGKAHWMFLEICRLHDQGVSFPSPQ